jgi:hypothetical protein
MMADTVKYFSDSKGVKKLRNAEVKSAYMRNVIALWSA